MNQIRCNKCSEIHKHCTAHLRRKKGSSDRLRPCQKYPVKDKTVCALHGGKTPRGFASPHFITGEHSKYLRSLPAEKEAEFQEALDEQKISLIENMALNDLRVNEMLILLNDSRLLEIWEELLIVIKKLEESILSLPEESFSEIPASKNPLSILVKLHSLLSRKNDNFKVWDEILELIERCRKLTETQLKVEAQEFDFNIKSSKLVPASIFRDYAFTLVEIFDLAPPDVAFRQRRAMQKEIDRVLSPLGVRKQGPTTKAEYTETTSLKPQIIKEKEEEVVVVVVEPVADVYDDDDWIRSLQ